MSQKSSYTGKETAPWYHWIAAYMMIGSGAVFTIIPEKPIWLVGLLIATAYAGWWIATRLPFEKKERVEPPS